MLYREGMPDALAGFAASAAMACSDIPFEHYISAVRVARINGEYVVNPTFQQMDLFNHLLFDK